VGLSDEAKAFELGHFGANSGRGDIKKLGQGNAANRGGNLSVLLDDGEESFLLAIR